MGSKKSKGSNKVVPIGAGSVPSFKKAARRREDPTSTLALNPTWIFSVMDDGGPWGRKLLNEKVIWDDILPKMRNFESMTWGQILREKKKFHFVPVGALCAEAQKRIQALKIDVDQLFRFRLTGKQRLWGIKVEGLFKILWWDPEHEICPSELKHT